jgi:hypothetical protein
MAVPVLPVSAGERLTPPAGELRDAVLADLKPHASSSKTYNEFWTYHFYLEGNLQAVLNFTRVNLGSFKSPVCGSDLTLMGFKGHNYSVAREYEKKNFVFDESRHQLRVHEKIYFEGRLPDTHRVRFETVKKGVSYLVDLTFSDILPGKTWGDGMFKFGSSEAVGIFIHIPSARVTGVISVNQDTLKVQGLAYMDHTFQTDLAPALVGSGFRYVTQAPPLEVGYVLDPASKFEGQPAGYGLRYEGAAATLLKPTGLKVLAHARALKSNVPTTLEIAFQDGTTATLRRDKDMLQQSTLHEFSGFTKKMIKSFMGGEVLTFKGVGVLNGTRPMAYNYFTVD